MALYTNSTVPLTCDPCLYTFSDKYPLLLALPCAFSLPLKGMLFWKQALTPLPEKTDLLSINLFFSDFILSLLAVATMATILLHSPVHPYVWSMLVGLLSIGHPLFHCFICVERYFAVKHPIVFLKYRPLRYRYVILTATWTVITVSTGFLVVLCVTNPNYSFGYLIFQCAFLFALVNINSFSCLSILKTLLRAPPGDKNLRGKRKKDGLDLRKKAFIIVVMIQVNLLGCYLPPIGLFLSASNVHSREYCFIYLFNVWYILLTSGVHSLFYMSSFGKVNVFKCFYKS